MICNNCGNQIPENSPYCTVCGATQNMYDTQNNYVAQSPMPQAFGPMLKLPTNRGLLKFILLSIITFGIYGIVVLAKLPGELDIAASRYDGRRTCPFFPMLYLTGITLGIYGLIWEHNFSNRIGAEVKRRGYNFNFGAADFWLWGVLGAFIIVGPYIYIHRLFKAMNMINASYNMYG